jgi:hypothetical protein
MKIIFIGCVAALVAGPALADPLVLLCKGTALWEDKAGTPGSLQTWKYYKIDDGFWAELKSTSVSWSRNLCTSKNVTCTIAATRYGMKIEYDGGGNRSVEINRQTGRVNDVADDGDFLQFMGDCHPSADPMPAEAPNRF